MFALGHVCVPLCVLHIGAGASSGHCERDHIKHAELSGASTTQRTGKHSAHGRRKKVNHATPAGTSHYSRRR
eukprot:scaffold445893_cov22-Prasinocladus_malaysianus.AAC.1